MKSTLTAIVTAFLVLLFLFVATNFVSNIYHYINTPFEKEGHSILIEIAEDTSMTKLAYQLEEKSIVRHPEKFILLARLYGVARHIKTGTYEINTAMNPHQLLMKIFHGDVLMHVQTIVEGWNKKQVFASFNENEYLHHTITDLSEEELCQELGIEQHSIEGWFYPESYLFAKGTPDMHILKQAHAEMVVLLNQLWQQREKTLPYKSPYEVLIIASLLEKEASLVNEQREIAGVILNRLQKNMRLQIDASVIYGLGDKYHGKLTKQLMREDTPYNTYRRHGLPPTPIAIPSIDALNAVMHPNKTKSLYYVARLDGTHVFSETFKQHQAAIKAIYKVKPSRQNK